MAHLVKIKVKKRKGELNTVLLNLDNIVDIERVSNRIHFTLIGNKERVGEWENADDAEDFFGELYSDF